MLRSNTESTASSRENSPLAHADEQRMRLEAKLRRELGEVIVNLLAEESTEDIVLNPDTSLWVKRRGSEFQRVGHMPRSQSANILATVAASKGVVVNADRPILEAELPLDGSRFEGVIAPVVRSPAFAIRLRPRRIFTLEDYERAGILTSKSDAANAARRQDTFGRRLGELSHAEIIRAAVAARKNILVVGSTGSGKTTFVNALLNVMAKVSPQDRVVTIEDTAELQCAVPNTVDLLAIGDVSMLDCLRACMRLKPSRIVVGEVRGAEAHTLLKAWNTGHPGGVATIHANDALSGLLRLESLVAEATTAPQQLLIAEAVDLVVFVDQEPGLPAGRKVREVALVTGYRDGRYQVELL